MPSVYCPRNPLPLGPLLRNVICIHVACFVCEDCIFPRCIKVPNDLFSVSDEECHYPLTAGVVLLSTSYDIV